MASVTNPNTWGTFKLACDAYNSGLFSGIGFVITKEDPFCFIDLDNPFELDQNGNKKYENPNEILETQIKIHSLFDSFSELSPSGKGLHIITKGSVPSGRRRNAVEIYSSARYMTVTGNIYNNTEIRESQELLNQLWEFLGGNNKSTIEYSGDYEETHSDNEIIEKAWLASNGEKFKDLFEGNWKDYYPSQSEADFALINIVSFYTQNSNQIKRIFRSSGLAKRPKAFRDDYINYMINKSFDRMIPLVNMESLKENMIEIINKKHEIEDKQVEEFKMPTKITLWPKGLIGEIAEFVHAQSPYPCEEISLCAALALVSGICGKSYNVLGSGVNNYIVLIAKTGCGKEAMAKGIDQIINCVRKTVPTAVDFIGPAEFASPQALSKYLVNSSPCFVSILTEFALFMSQMAGDKANSNMVGLRRLLLNLYNKSGHGQIVQGIVYSDKEKNTKSLNAPAFTFLGECTPEKYYKILNEDMVLEGLLPRFTTIEFKGYTEYFNENHYLQKPSEDLIQKVATICTSSSMLISNNQVTKVQMNEKAHKILFDYNTKCRSKSSFNDSNGVERELLTRAHMKATKLAAIVAIGINPFHPTITDYEANWAINIIEMDNKNILKHFDTGEVGTETNESKQLNEFRKLIYSFIKSPFKANKFGINRDMYERGIVSYRYISAKLAPNSEFRNDRFGASNALKKAISTLIDCGELQEIPPNQSEKHFGIRQKCYAIKQGV